MNYRNLGRTGREVNIIGFGGEHIDGKPYVYTMGAAAFVLLSGGQDRSAEKREAGKALFGAAKKAVSGEHERRQRSIEEFIEEWEAAKRGNITVQRIKLYLRFSGLNRFFLI